MLMLPKTVLAYTLGFEYHGSDLFNKTINSQCPALCDRSTLTQTSSKLVLGNAPGMRPGRRPSLEKLLAVGKPQPSYPTCGIS